MENKIPKKEISKFRMETILRHILEKLKPANKKGDHYDRNHKEKDH